MSENATLLDGAILTPDEVESGKLEGLPDDLTILDDNGGITGIINSVTTMIDGHLDRQLFVHPFTRYFEAFEWEDSPHPSYSFELYADEWPFIEATDSNTVFAGPARPGMQKLYTNIRLESLAGFRGYRRSDQSLADLQGLTGLASLTVLPELFPADIRDVALAICLHIIEQRMKGAYSGQRTTQTVGNQTFTIEASSQQFIESQLARLHRYSKVI